jgi:colicin import membrane protein
MKWTVATIVAGFFAVVLASCATSDLQRGAVAEGDEGPVADLLRRQLYACWTPPVDANITVTVHFSLHRDGSLAGSPTVVQTSTGAQFQAVAASAVRAVRRCTPLKLPADKYDYWGEIEATFDPHDLQ